ncbi:MULTISPECIES: GNAT family N-acetyltransferase [Streptomyces]|uniref:GNAT family N-acetyltransferase n=1 Tax=Streptomyces TaxID=1883 RepID=UPI0006EBBB30|nr:MULTISPECIES: GNAT family N-acetyltransferase [Streptomyces]
MIEIAPHQLPALARWFPAGVPGPSIVGEHALVTGHGQWWADHLRQRGAIAVTCAGHTVLRGSTEGLTPASLAPLAHHHVDAPARFLPLLNAAFDQVTPWERMVWTQQVRARPCRPPRGIHIRRLEPADTDGLVALGTDADWISGSWGGPLGLAASGHAWTAADQGGRLLAIACTFFRGRQYEDVAVFTVPDRRRHRLGLACVTALTADIRDRGHLPSWNCSVLNRSSRLLAWTAGFRLVREYVHYATGSAVSVASQRTAA